jgi:hypothetical protein
MFVSCVCVCCVGSGPCDGLITPTGESYRVCVCACVCVCVYIYIYTQQKGTARQGSGDKEKVVMNYCSLQRTIRFKTIEGLLDEILGD